MQIFETNLNEIGLTLKSVWAQILIVWYWKNANESVKNQAVGRFISQITFK